MKTHLQVVPMLAVVGFLPTGLVSAEDSALPTAKPKAVPVVSIGMDSPALDYNFSSSGLPNVNLGKMATKPVPPKPVKPVPKEFMEVPTPVESKPEKPKSVYVAPTFLPVAKPAVAPSKTMAPLAPKPETMNATTFPTLKAIPMEKQLESLDQTQLQAELPKMNTTVELKPIPKTEIKPLKPVTASTTKVVPSKVPATSNDELVKVMATSSRSATSSVVTGRLLQEPQPIRETVLFDVSVCASSVRTLGASEMEADRVNAMTTLSKMKGWQSYQPCYPALRKVALTEYNTKMRQTAVEMLGSATMEHTLVADTLKLSAMYDSDAEIRMKARQTLEKLASLPPDPYRTR